MASITTASTQQDIWGWDSNQERVWNSEHSGSWSQKPHKHGDLIWGKMNINWDSKALKGRGAQAWVHVFGKLMAYSQESWRTVSSWKWEPWTFTHQPGESTKKCALFQGLGVRNKQKTPKQNFPMRKWKPKLISYPKQIKLSHYGEKPSFKKIIFKKNDKIQVYAFYKILYIYTI